MKYELNVQRHPNDALSVVGTYDTEADAVNAAESEYADAYYTHIKLIEADEYERFLIYKYSFQDEWWRYIIEYGIGGIPMTSSKRHNPQR